jgi:putative oxidoreductase
MRGKIWFMAGAISSFFIAILHIVIIFIGAEGYRYFGAGEEMATMDESGSYIPAAVTAGIACVFTLFGMYALSASGAMKKLPLLKISIIAITVIYTVRGSGFFIELLGIIYDYDVPLRHAVFSFVSLITGLTHLIGLVKAWCRLSQNAKSTNNNP